ncbi:hypothetical protein VA596_04225 [Amycolatopsis sp., V23-08]|uniref:Rho termination factor N-terminal domain-containing protein n=1 Tax=Amycolatopsis heterodermiae TaxID=3110235 RepID=A0ABU5R041_9PSEU|nr:hypothetical protein [Amycolatopsis sp., V23-08]MEA5358731.1 hypothetical protein [Amycolatopsis sp., V23-08]
MSNLKSFAVLQARVYEFLEQQDEATLQAIVSGEAQLTVLHEDVAPAAPIPQEDAPVAALPTPADDLSRAVHELSQLTSEDDRRTYLNAADLKVPELKSVAKLLRLRNYSKLAQAKLIDLLARHSQTDANAAVPSRQKTPLVDLPARQAQPEPPADKGAEQPPATPKPPPVAPAESNADVAAITARLTEIETEPEGAAYLKAQHLNRETLLAVAAELQLTRVERLSQTELQKKILRQAIGARRRFAGLRKW